MHIRLRALVVELTKKNQSLSRTRILHSILIKNRLTNDPFYATKITRFYAINDDLVSARNLFDRAPQQSSYLWNSIIRAYARSHKFYDTFLLFNRLLESEIQPDNYTFACMLRACCEKFDLVGFRSLHGKVIVSGLGLDCICNSSLVSCYSNLSLLDEANGVFVRVIEPDLVLWNVMISAYGSCGSWVNAMELFCNMLMQGSRPDGYTMVGLLTGLSGLGLTKKGESIHGFCVKCGLITKDHVISMLVTVYSRCMNFDLACSLFGDLVSPDLVTCSALISASSDAGDYVNALILFKKFLMGGGRADYVLLACVLSASARLAIASPGCVIHGYAIRRGCDTDVKVSSALVDMYAKCGFLELGVHVFNQMVERNITSFNSVISALGLYGHAAETFRIFKELLESGLKPDEITFAGLLSACCHSGLVIEARHYFNKMIEEFGIVAKAEHYVYMVKVLGMGGQMAEAYDFIKSLPMHVDCSLWGALLSCCAAHKNYALAEVVNNHIAETTPRSFRYSIMHSNLLADDGRWNDVMRLRVDGKGVLGKMPGISWIGV